MLNTVQCSIYLFIYLNWVYKCEYKFGQSALCFVSLVNLPFSSIQINFQSGTCDDFFYKRKLLSTFFPKRKTSSKDICFASPFTIRSPSTALTCICTYTVIKSIFLYSSPAFYSGSITRSNVMTSMLSKLSS